MTHVLVIAACFGCTGGLLRAEMKMLEAPAIAIFVKFRQKSASRAA